MKKILIGTVGVFAILTVTLATQHYFDNKSIIYSPEKVKCNVETYIDFTTGKPANCSGWADHKLQHACIKQPVMCKDLSGKPITGKIEYRNEKNQLTASKTYVNGLQNGPWIVNYENGSQMWVIDYKDGFIDGHSKRYTKEGKVVSDSTYEKGKLKHMGVFYLDGKRWSEIDLDNNMDGKGTFYFPDGKISETIMFKKGKAVGNVKTYFPNGTLERSGTYINGIAHGLEETFFPNGKHAKKLNYDNGKVIGDAFIYYPNGQLKTVIQMTQHEKVDYIKTFTDNGLMLGEIYFGTKENADKSLVYDAETQKHLMRADNPTKFDHIFTALMRQIMAEQNASAQQPATPAKTEVAAPVKAEAIASAKAEAIAPAKAEVVAPVPEKDSVIKGDTVVPAASKEVKPTKKETVNKKKVVTAPKKAAPVKKANVK